MLFGIRIYWIFIPAKARNVCLFKESCSKHVYRTTKEQSWKSGLAALTTRFMECRTPYKIVDHRGLIYLHTRKGTVLNQNEINPTILKTEQIASID